MHWTVDGGKDQDSSDVEVEVEGEVDSGERTLHEV